jgi:flagellar motor protein MotB
MYAQQGRFVEAEGLWRELVRQDPGNEAYQRALQHVTRRQRPPRLAEAALGGAKWAAALLLLGVLIWVLVRLGQVQQSVEAQRQPQPVPTIVMLVPTSLPQSTPEARPTQAPPAAAGGEALAKSLDELKTQVAALQAGLSRTGAPTPTPAARLPDLNLKIPGILVQPEAGRLVLVFEKGLFQYSWVMTAEGQAALKALAIQLEPVAGQLHITLVGFASDDEVSTEPFNPGNLGLMRALTVYDTLTRVYHLPGEAFSLLPQEGTPPPFRSDSAQNREKNHTVVIWLAPRSR